MLCDADICWKCEHYAESLTLYRCWRCRDFACEHYLTDGVCSVPVFGKSEPKRPRECEDKEHTKVLRAWRDELNKSGICVSYSYRFDECCKELDWTESGDWICRYCHKNIGKVPPPDSCAGCGGHSVDPDCPLHGKYYD